MATNSNKNLLSFVFGASALGLFFFFGVFFSCVKYAAGITCSEHTDDAAFPSNNYNSDKNVDAQFIIFAIPLFNGSTTYFLFELFTRFFFCCCFLLPWQYKEFLHFCHVKTIANGWTMWTINGKSTEYHDNKQFIGNENQYIARHSIESVGRNDIDMREP